MLYVHNIYFEREEKNDDDVKKAIAYEKIVLKYPIDACMHDVVFVIIPGVSDIIISREYLLSI